MSNVLANLCKSSIFSFNIFLDENFLNKSKTGWTAPINLWRSQFKKDCQEINRLANKITDINKFLDTAKYK